jgi:hypothetical protein
MSTTYFDSTTSIRRRGVVVTLSSHDHDGYWPNGKTAGGTRRDRQIAKRHWVRKEGRWWSSGGGAGQEVSVKTPGKEVGLLMKKTWV